MTQIPFVIADLHDITKAVVQRPEACNFIKKETLTQVFSCEFCENFENTSFYITPLVAASE